MSFNKLNQIIDEEEINTDNSEESISKISEYFILQEGSIYKFNLCQMKNNISIRYKKYDATLILAQISSLTKTRFDSINECYNFLSDLFEEKKINIKEINANSSIKLSLKINKSFAINEEIEMELKYNENKSNSIMEELNDKYNKLSKTIKEDKKELNSLKKEAKSMKMIQNNEIPKDIQYQNDVATDSFANFSYEDSFTVFKSINDILELVYATKDKSIIAYDLNNTKLLHKLFKSHNNYITNFKHYLDKINKRDIIMSLSKKDNNIKLWNANSWEQIKNIENVNQKDFLYSACFLNANSTNYIITSNGCNRQYYMNIHNFEPMKLYDFNGEKIKDLNDTNDCTFFIDSYFDDKLSKNFIVTGNYNYIKSYDYDKGEIYKKYFENNNGIHPSVIIKKTEEKIKLIESCEDGIIRIWEFHSGKLLRKIKTDNNNLYGLCLWNDNYAFVGCKDQTIKLIELKNGLLIKSYNNHKGRIISFKKIVEPGIGECLLSQGLDQKIKLWINKTKRELSLN